MKNVLLFFLLLCFTQCSSSKKSTTSESQYLQVLLQEKVKLKSIILSYQKLGIQSMKLSSRSQELYQTKVELSPKKLKKLIAALEKDTRVVSVQLIQSTPNTSSTNEGFGTSKPKTD